MGALLCLFGDLRRFRRVERLLLCAYPCHLRSRRSAARVSVSDRDAESESDAQDRDERADDNWPRSDSRVRLHSRNDSRIPKFF